MDDKEFVELQNKIKAQHKKDYVCDKCGTQIKKGEVEALNGEDNELCPACCRLWDRYFTKFVGYSREERNSNLSEKEWNCKWYGTFWYFLTGKRIVIKEKVVFT